MADVQQTSAGAGSGLPSAIWRPMADGVAILATLLCVGWALSLQRTLGLGLYPEQFFAAILGLIMALAFLSLPAKQGTTRTHVPWTDAALALLSVLTVGHIAVNFPDLVLVIFTRPPALWVPAVIVTLLLLETLRRATGWALVIIITVFLLYALFGDVVPGRLQGRPQNWQMLAGYMVVDANGILGLPMSIAATVVVTFILFGALLGITGGSQFFTDASMLLMGRFRGGSMKIAVMSSALFGAISGSAVANVVATGVVTIPMIKKDGYPAHKAAAIEAVASTGGQLMPPVMGASAFLMAELLSISYADVVKAALIPSLLFYIALLIQADLDAARLGIRRVAADLIPKGRTVLTGLHFMVCFGVLIYLLFWKNYLPERAALWASLALIITAMALGYRGERPKLRAIVGSLAQTGHGIVEIILISAASGIVIGVLNITGLSFNLTYLLVQIGGGSLIMLLALAAVVCLILGMGLPTLGVYVLLAALVAPALVELGIEPIAAHLYVMYFGMMSMITPPVALAAFAAASIAKASPMATGWASCKFGWSAFIIPVLFVFSPTLIMIGAPLDIGIAVITAILGVWLISAALAGFFGGKLGMGLRWLFGIFGLLALIPAGAFPGAGYTDIIGVIGGGAVMVLDILRSRRAAALQVTEGA